ncbi:hypothetical protein F652_2804 [Enterobacteriaceae bacterium bta3-1]|nr:hypothetical protein F652_2804 [Enterobacteriaceae bacterium bta3-1]
MPDICLVGYDSESNKSKCDENGIKFTLTFTFTFTINE